MSETRWSTWPTPWWSRASWRKPANTEVPEGQWRGKLTSTSHCRLVSFIDLTHPLELRVEYRQNTICGKTFMYSKPFFLSLYFFSLSLILRLVFVHSFILTIGSFSSDGFSALRRKYYLDVFGNAGVWRSILHIFYRWNKYLLPPCDLECLIFFLFVRS